MPESAKLINVSEEQKIHARFQKTLFSSKRTLVALYKGLERDADKRYFKVITHSDTPTNRPVILVGTWNDKKKAFKVNRFEEVPPPSEEENVLNYLIDISIPGLGPGVAKRIVDLYGKDAISVMGDRDALMKVKDISLKRAEDFVREWQARDRLREYRDFFHEMGIPVSKAAAASASMQMLDLSLDDVKKNPYLLCNCEELSFSDVDDAVMTCTKDASFFRTCRDRMFFGILDTLRHFELQGHSFARFDYLTNLVLRNLFQNERDKAQLVRYYIKQLDRRGEIVYEKAYDAVYSKRIYDAENGCAELLGTLLFSFRRHNKPDLIKRLIQEADPDHTLSDKQQESILNAFTNNVSIITGGPGMGKTYCLKALLSVFDKLAGWEVRDGRARPKIVLCAPTGRAARKMEENANYPASTIHHLLKLSDDGVFSASPVPIDADMVVVDEFSMVGIELFFSLLRCIKNGTALVLIGDKDQLPSVSCGNVLNDLISSGAVPVTRLNKIYRQQEGCSIIDNAYIVNTGIANARRLPKTDRLLKIDESTEFISVEGEEACLRETLKAAERAAMLYGAANVQVITPLRNRSRVCMKVLNAELQKLFNPPSGSKEEFKRRDVTFRLGDRVMQLKNGFVDGKYFSNGDIGVISQILVREKRLRVNFDNGRSRWYEGPSLDELEHAFAMTVHKSQGSEFDAVILPFIEEFAGMRQKKLLYTAITRAKEKLVIVGDAYSIPIAMTGADWSRNSLFGFRLSENIQFRSVLDRFGTPVR